MYYDELTAYDTDTALTLLQDKRPQELEDTALISTFYRLISVHMAQSFMHFLKRRATTMISNGELEDDC